MKILLFTKNNCRPCAEKKPTVIQLATIHETPLVVHNVDESAESLTLAKQYGIRAVPTAIVLNEAEEVAQTLTGPLITWDALERALSE